MKRNYIIDKWRGFTIISMVLFHLMYNIDYYWNISWYQNQTINRLWQFSIAGSFFVISGITANFLPADKNIKRGIITSLIGFTITAVTFVAAPDQFILWGVLNGLGASMIITGLLKKYTKMDYKVGLVFLLIFIVTYNIPRGSLYGHSFFNKLYDANLFFLGFPAASFSSTDYFPIIPWVFLYLFGFYLGKFLLAHDFFGSYGTDSLLAKIGRHSMTIYLAHQVILYPLVTLIYMITK